jgi:hypothetical protein
MAAPVPVVRPIKTRLVAKCGTALALSGQIRFAVDLISDRFRYGPIWYAGPDAIRNAVAYAKYRSLSRSHRANIRVLDDFGAVIQTH